MYSNGNSSAFGSLDDAESLRELVRHLREGIYIVTQDGRFLDGNPALLEMFGVSSLNELRRYKMEDLIVDQAERRRELELLTRHGSVREFELKLRRPDGRIRTALDAAYTCRDPGTGELLFRGILVDITERKRLESQLLEQSIRDPLTGCFNRRYLDAFEELADNIGWGVLAVDIDDFKKYNDSHGHQAGDEVLIKISRLLMRQARAEEGVVRMGGDEFVVLLGGADEVATETAANRLRNAAGREAPIRFSLGWAVRRSQEKLEKTLNRADQNMFEVRLRRRRERRNNSSRKA
jgi:diguanylate cyclase (GGDEF)-like protein/PAS domain S-box-containing protein